MMAVGQVYMYAWAGCFQAIANGRRRPHLKSHVQVSEPPRPCNTNLSCSCLASPLKRVRQCNWGRSGGEGEKGGRASNNRVIRLHITARQGYGQSLFSPARGPGCTARLRQAKGSWRERAWTWLWDVGNGVAGSAAYMHSQPLQPTKEAGRFAKCWRQPSGSGSGMYLWCSRRLAVRAVHGLNLRRHTSTPAAQTLTTATQTITITVSFVDENIFFFLALRPDKYSVADLDGNAVQMHGDNRSCVTYCRR